VAGLTKRVTPHSLRHYPASLVIPRLAARGAASRRSEREWALDDAG